MAAPAATAAPAADSAPSTRPTKPDENVFKQELAKAEKEHKASMDKFVCFIVKWLVSLGVSYLHSSIYKRLYSSVQ